MRERFVTWQVTAPTAEAAEIAAAFAFEAGASGTEELVGTAGLRVFAAEARAEAVQAALAELSRLGVASGEPQPVADADWSTAWRRELSAIVVADALVVRPPFRPSPDASLPELVIEPGQAFGTGGHASTRLALELMVDLDWHGLDLLDVGTGSGVLALGALRLGATRAVGFDLDSLAAPAAAANARQNGLGARLGLFTGPIDALAKGVRFEVVVANMIRSEQEPVLGQMLACAGPDGRLLLSGLLQDEEERMTALLGRHGWFPSRRLAECDERGDAWLALEARRGGSG